MLYHLPEMIGTKLAHYEILEELGRGGMGVVYKARDTHLDRFVAIKVLPAEKVAHRERQQRFVQEAKSASALNHPNIVTVYDIAEEDGTAFIAMEYVAGKTLAELIPRQGMPLGEVLKHAVQIASALTAAHQGGIVHRDLKPGNVIVGADGRLRLVDFGLAKLFAADSDSDVTLTFRDSSPQTQEGTILGTAAYMSPEQAGGREVDARSDIFSLGSLLYEMATGRSAFQGDSAMSTMGAIIHKEPDPLPPEVPHDLQKLIQRCLRKDVARRYQHMADVKVVLEELKEESDSGTLTAAPATERPAPRTAPWRLAAVLAVAVLAVAVLVALAGWWWRPQPRVETAPLVATPLTSYPGIEQTPALSPSGEQVAFSWNGEAQDNFDIYVQVVGAAGTVRLTDDPAFDWAPTWSPDGREIVFYRYWPEGKFAVVSVPSLPGRERTIREYPFPPGMPNEFLYVLRPALSPDGEWSAGTGESGLLLTRRGSGEMRAIADVPGGAETFPAFSPDGRSLAFISWRTGGVDTDLYVVRLTEAYQADGEPERLTSGMRLAHRPAWMPDGREIIFSAAAEIDQGLWRVAASGASAARRVVMVGGGAWSPSISSDGQRLVYEHRTMRSSLWRVGVGAPEGAAERITSSTRGEAWPSYSPDGTRIAFSSDRSGSLEIWMADADGSGSVKMTSLEQFSVGSEWSPDGRWIVFQSSGEFGNQLYVVGAAGGGSRPLTGGSEDALQPSWSPDGEWIYFMSSRSGTKQIWRLPAAGGEAVQVTRGGGEFARVSPDGSELYFTRGIYGSLELWKATVTGEDATRVDVPPIYDWGFAIAGERLYFTTPPQGQAYPVMALDLSSGKTEEVARIGFTPFPRFSASPDGKWLVYYQGEQANSDLMLVEGFR